MMEKTEAEERKKTRRYGFAGMSLEKRRAIASLGGKAAHEQGRAHKFTSEEAQAAGRKGGMISKRRRRVEVPVNMGQVL